MQKSLKERLGSIATGAARREQGNAQNGLTINCAYIGVKSENGYDLASRVTRRAEVGFAWDVAGGAGIQERHVVELRCDHACDRGVKFPESWKSACKI